MLIMHADCVRRKTFNGLAGTFGYVGGIWLSGALGVAWQVLAASLLTSFRRLVRYVSPMCLSCKPNQRSFTMKLFFAQFFYSIYTIEFPLINYEFSITVWIFFSCTLNFVLSGQFDQTLFGQIDQIWPIWSIDQIRSNWPYLSIRSKD